MRTQFGAFELTTNVTRFLIAIIASYLIFALFSGTITGISAYNSLVLEPYRAVYSLQVWRLFTYAFLHDLSSPFHVIFNGLLLFMLGPQMENHWGEKRFLYFCIIAILMGGFFVCGAFILGLTSNPVVGFSSVGVGLIIAWGITFSERQIYILGLIPITGKNLVFLTIGMEILYSVSSSSISSAAHFGGIATGIILTLGLYKPGRIKQLWRQVKMKRKHRR